MERPALLTVPDGFLDNEIIKPELNESRGDVPPILTMQNRLPNHVCVKVLQRDEQFGFYLTSFCR